MAERQLYEAGTELHAYIPGRFDTSGEGRSAEVPKVMCLVVSSNSYYDVVDIVESLDDESLLGRRNAHLVYDFTSVPWGDDED